MCPPKPHLASFPNKQNHFIFPQSLFFYFQSKMLFLQKFPFFPAELHLPHTSFSLLLLHSRSQMIFNNNFISSACVCLIRCSVMLQPMHSDRVANRSNKYFLHLLSNTRILELMVEKLHFCDIQPFYKRQPFCPIYTIYTHIHIQTQ